MCTLRIFASISGFAVASTLATGCDSGPGTPMGEGGGEVWSADGRMVLDVPPGALDQEITIAITDGGDCMDGGSVCYGFEPYGLALAVPARLTYFLDPAGPAASFESLAGAAVFGTWDGTGTWSRLADREVDVEAGTVSSTVVVLGDVSVVLPAR